MMRWFAYQPSPTGSYPVPVAFADDPRDPASNRGDTQAAYSGGIMQCWFDDRLDRLRELMQFHTFSEIGKIMGITKNAAVGAANRHLGGKRPAPEPRAAIEFPPTNICRWIDGDVKLGTATFSCGERVLPGESYCRAHRRRVYQPRYFPVATP